MNRIGDLIVTLSSCPFEPPCFAPEFFFDAGVLSVVRGAIDERVVVDQWGCDVPLRGSQNQAAHVDYQRGWLKISAI